MKRLNKEDFEIMKWALNFKQLDEIKEKGMLSITKEEAIETLKRSIKLTEDTRNQLLENEIPEEQKEFINKIIEGGKLRQKEEQELINKLENDNEDYEIKFMKGSRED